MKPRDAERSKNFFALGLISWMYTRPEQATIDWIDEKFGSKPAVRDANLAAFKAGHAFGETAELFDHPYEVQPAEQPAGHLHQHHRQHRPGVGPRRRRRSWPSCRCSSARTRSPRRPTSSTSSRSTRTSACARSRPRTRSPASARPSAPPSAATSASPPPAGPGVALKAEAIGLAVSLELPLLIVDVQRGGPSTGLPTKTEQSDLLLAMYGRHGEAPLPIVSASHARRDCFDAAIEAARIALKYRTPVILLTDGYLANGAEPWLLPDVRRCPTSRCRSPPSRTTSTTTARRRSGRTSATPRRSPGRGPSRARRPRAPHRRHREGGRHGQRHLRPREPRAHGAPPGREGRRHRQRHPRRRGRRRRRRRRAPGRRLGLHLGRHQRRRGAGAGRRPQGRPRAPHPPQPVPRQPRRGPAPLPEGRWCPR